MFVVSLNYKRASLALREKLSFDEAGAVRLLESLRDAGIEECVYLATCSRVEVYGVGDFYRALELLGGYGEDVKNRVLFYTDERAAEHLFRVACGMDSMVLGEDEILGQVKKAFAFSAERGYTGYELNTVFKAAITCSKRIKTDTMLSKSAVSTATLAAARCRKFAPGRKTVLLIGGSGEIGGKTLKDLISYREFDIYATSRTAVRENHVADSVTMVAYENRFDCLAQADIVISATKSPHFTITADCVPPGRRRLFIDLAVPRDIDGMVAALPDAELVTIDDLESLAKDNNERKREELKSAEHILEEELDALSKELTFHDLLPKLDQGDAPKRFIYDFRNEASAEEFRVFARVLSRMGGAG